MRKRTIRSKGIYQILDNEIKVEFERRLLLTCDASYVKLPRLFVMMNQNREFSIRIDPTGLEKGVPHFTQVIIHSYTTQHSVPPKKFSSKMTIFENFKLFSILGQFDHILLDRRLRCR